MKAFTYSQLTNIIQEITKSKKKVLYVAGATASGKSYVTKRLQEELTKLGKKVLMISADHYYRPDSSIQSMIYGTYDHPNLIDHDLLNDDIGRLLVNGSFDMPEYSFSEKTRVGYTTISGNFDYILVEGLYVINKCSPQYDPLTIFVHSQPEDLIIRRLVRDPERSKEPLYMVATTLTKVFPMWTIAGAGQLEKSDLVINNNYEILADKGITYDYIRTKDFPKGELSKTEYIVNYVYNDHRNDEDSIVISEIYHEYHGYLHEVKISKVQENNNGTQEWLSLSMIMPGLLVDLHTLIQLAGCHFIKKESHKKFNYIDGTVVHQKDSGELFKVIKHQN